MTHTLAPGAVPVLPGGYRERREALDRDEDLFAALAAAEDLSPDLRAVLVRSAGSYRPPDQARARVRLVLSRPDLTGADLHGLVQGALQSTAAGALPELAPLVLAHPGCTDAAAVALLDLPFNAEVPDRLFGCAAAATAPAWRGASSGRTSGNSWLDQLAGVLEALTRAGHPVAGALALLIRPAERRGRLETDVLLETTGVLAALARLRRAATEAGVPEAALVATLTRLARGWAGTAEELLASALAVATG